MLFAICGCFLLLLLFSVSCYCFLLLLVAASSPQQEAVNFVRIRLSENGDLSQAAKELTKHALDQGSVDNVSVVLVWCQDLPGQGGAEAAAAGGRRGNQAQAPSSDPPYTPSRSRSPPDQ